MRTRWPLTGRGAELDAVAAALRRGTGVVLAGGAGVGKTRLARETAALVACRGTHTHWVGATASSASVPLGCFASLLAEGPAGAGDAVAALGRLARALGSPAVLVVDDAHRLDALSATLVHQLVVGRVVPAVLTLRTGEPAPDGVTALWKDGHLDRLEVAPLPAQESATLLAAVLGGPVETESADRLWQVTRGNALYLQQLVEGELAAGHLRREDHAWRWRGDPALRPQLVELIEARIGRLTDPVGRVLELLAFGEPLPLDVLTALAGPAAVEEAEARALLTVRGMEASSGHPLYAEVVRGRTPTTRGRRLRGELVRAARPDADPLRTAVLVLDSDAPADPKLLLRAAQQADRYLDIPLAERLARASREAGGGFFALVTHGWALLQQGEPAAAMTVFDDAADVATSDAHRCYVTAYRATAQHYWMRLPDEAATTLRIGQEQVSDPAARQELAAVGADLDSSAGRFETVASAARPLVAGPTTVRARGIAAGALLDVAGTGGRIVEAVELAAVARRALDGAWLPTSVRMTTATREVIALCLAGLLDQADAAATERAGWLAGGRVLGPVVGLLRSHVLLARGALRAAVAAAADALGDQARHGFITWQLGADLVQGQALAMAGDADRARQALAGFEREYGQHLAVYAPDLELARAWTSAAEGTVSVASERAMAAADVARAGAQHATEVLALQTAVQFGDGTVAGRLVDLAVRVEGPRAPAAAAHAAALAADDAPALLAASRGWEGIGALLVAADAAAQACVAFRGAGRFGSAAAAAGRAHDLAGRCGGARTPALRAGASVLPLTSREREIAALIAAGLSNRAIADRLVVSVRTVEGHIYRACGKLDLTDRAALGALLDS